MKQCPYITGRRCLLKGQVPGVNPFATAAFCRNTCGDTDAEKVAMLAAYRHVIDILPDAGQLQDEYAQRRKTGCGGKCVKGIMAGFGKLAWQRISGGNPDKETIRRSAICAECEHRTFLNAMKWAMNLTQTGDLPINHEPGDWDALWCSICKCCIEAKIRVQDEHCPLGRWAEDTDNVENNDVRTRDERG